ncbi:MAG: LptF/LptG family permease, partial [Ferruginibacter sp.]
MKKLDKYILGKYLSTFFFCILLLTVIVVVVDISEKTDDFVRSKLPASKIITDYYFGFIPRIDAMLFPLFVFISVIFFTSKLAGRSEIIAMLSSGMSFRRFLLPYFLGGIFLSVLLWAGYQYVVPQANRKWGDFEKTYVDSRSSDAALRVYKQNLYFRLNANTYAGIKGYDTITKKGNNLFIQQFDNNRMIYNLRALNFNWDTAKQKWLLSNVVERQVKEKTENITRSNTKYGEYNFKPIDLRKDDYLKDQMTTPDLDRFIALE